MAGALNFTMGLATTGFLSKLGGAAGSLKNFNALALAANAGMAALTVGGAALGATLAGVFKEIEAGGAMQDLSNRTGETVSDLTKLQYAFKQVGLDGGSVAPLLGQMQKALGGVNENGEPTGKVFEQLGLSIEELKGMDAPAALDAITKKLVGLDKSTATNLSAKIFGRNGAGDALQIARSAGEFADGLKEAAPYAAIVARNAVAWKQIGDTMTNIGLKSKTFFAGIAEGAAPGMQVLLDKLNGVDFGSWGLKIGEALSVAAQAFKAGELGELLSLGLTAAFEKGALFFGSLFSNPDLYTGLAQGLFGVLASFGKGLVSAALLFTDALEAGKKTLYTGDTFKEAFTKQREISKAGMNAVFGTDAEFAANAFGFRKDGAADLGSALTKAMADSVGGEAGKAFAALYEKNRQQIPDGARAIRRRAPASFPASAISAACWASTRWNASGPASPAAATGA
jgi:hypothetical protein